MPWRDSAETRGAPTSVTAYAVATDAPAWELGRPNYGWCIDDLVTVVERANHGVGPMPWRDSAETRQAWTRLGAPVNRPRRARTVTLVDHPIPACQCHAVSRRPPAVNQWDALATRFGAPLSPTLIDWFEDVHLTDRLPFRLWLPEVWVPLAELARTEARGGAAPPPAGDHVVIGERTHAPEGVASEDVYYCLSPSTWSGNVVPLFQWHPGGRLRQVHADLARLPAIQRALADRWLLGARYGETRE